MFQGANKNQGQIYEMVFENSLETTNDQYVKKGSGTGGGATPKSGTSGGASPKSGTGGGATGGDSKQGEGEGAPEAEGEGEEAELEEPEEHTNEGEVATVTNGLMISVSIADVDLVQANKLDTKLDKHEASSLFGVTKGAKAGTSTSGGNRPDVALPYAGIGKNYRQHIKYHTLLFIILSQYIHNYFTYLQVCSLSPLNRLSRFGIRYYIRKS